MRVLVTGGAGFIGSHLCDRLIERGDQVWCVDNLHLGRVPNVAHLVSRPAFHFVELDVLDEPGLWSLFDEAKFDAVFHLAANSDIAAGADDPAVDFSMNLMTTMVVLEVMRTHGVRRLFFASTSAVFGEHDGPLREGSGPMRPISNYGASKLAAEAFVSVFAHVSGNKAVVMRFPNVVGPRATHGVILDFLSRLRASPGTLCVLGDGSQCKPYLHVDDLVDAIFVAWDADASPHEVYHAAGEGSTTVREIAHIVAGNDARVVYGGRCWPGDVRSYAYDCSKLRALGWRPRWTSTEAVRRAVAEVREELRAAS